MSKKNRLASTVFSKIQQKIRSKPVEEKKGREQPLQGCSRFFEESGRRLATAPIQTVVNCFKRAYAIGYSPSQKEKGIEGVLFSLDALIA